MLPSVWGPILRDPRSRKVIVVSIAFGREFTLIAKDLHPGLLPGAARCATHPNTLIPMGSITYPYWPTIIGWPTIENAISIIDRRAEIAAVKVRIMANADIPLEALGVGGLPSAYARIDLWSDGVSFDEMIPLIQGPVTGSSYSRGEGTIELDISDGDIKRKVEFPPGQFRIDRDEFPFAPDYVAGYAPRSTIFGPFPDQVPCYQIDQYGKEFYVCEPALTVAPSDVYIGGVNIDTMPNIKFPHHVIGSLSNDQTYSKLVFDIPIKDTSLVGQVTCGGGFGISGEHPAISLLKYGKYNLSNEALASLRSLPLNFFVFINNSGNVYEMVTGRILPQTDLIGGLRMDKYHTYKIGSSGNEVSLSPGSGLIFRDVREDIETSADEVFNAIEVRFQRDLFTVGETTRTAYLIDKENGQQDIRSLLRLSERLYGRRYLKLEAPDLVQYLDSPVNGVPKNVINLALTTAKVKALIHKEYTYLTEWHIGMAVDLNWKVYLTDPELNLVNQPTRIIKREISPVGPKLTLQTEIAT